MPRLRIPSVLVVLAVAGCTGSQTSDGGIDAAFDGGTCDANADGQMCETVCWTAGSGGNYDPSLCQYYCDVPTGPGQVTDCFLADGSQAIDCQYDSTQARVIC